MFRGGVAYDQTPTNSTDLTPRLAGRRPDVAGVRRALQASPPIGRRDVAYAYTSCKSPSINQNGGSTAANGLINGSYNSNVKIVGAQIKYGFD